MKRNKVIFKDFGKITTDAENEKEAFIDMISNDIKGRIERFFV